MAKIKRFIECLIPVTACNLHCDYCYITQNNQRTNQMPDLKYGENTIVRALSKKRLGGCSYISICGAGETLLPPQIVGIVQSLLAEGHFVNLTTNGTITERFNELLEIPAEHKSRLHFAFSFHYLELNKRNLLDTFFQNVQKVRDHGCSFLVQMNMYDGYIPHLKKIRRLCIKNVGAPPQVAVTRNEMTNPVTLLTKLPHDDYLKLGKGFDSPLFDFTMKNFMVKRHEYCYAGKWSGVLDLGTGMFRRCYSDTSPQNIFENPSIPINFKEMGHACKSVFCANSSHFMSLGVIPTNKTPSYEALRNRPAANWYTSKMRHFLSGKLIYSNFNPKVAFNLIKIKLYQLYSGQL